MGTAIVLIILAVAVGSIIKAEIKKKQSGKGGCGGCDHCASNGMCHH